MVHRTYAGLGAPEAAARDFESLRPYVQALWGLQDVVGYFTDDGGALDIALNGLQTAAFHFTRRPHFYGPREALPAAADLRQRAVVAMVFEALRPYAQALRHLQSRCRPFGQDWRALDIALKGLETAAFHFTRVPHFYGDRGDSAGAVRPLGEVEP